MKLLTVLAFCVVLAPDLASAAELNLATLTCSKYENEILPSASTDQNADSINTVMWLFGFAVAKSGAHVMYGDALSAFGFGLDGECKSNPNESLLNAVSIVKPDQKNPMDLMTLACATFAARHVDLARTDAESANTIMMWLYGFSVGKSGSHVFDTAGLGEFAPALLAQCAKRPDANLFDALLAVKTARPAP